MFESYCELLGGILLFIEPLFTPIGRTLVEFLVLAKETWCRGEDGGLSSVSLGLLRSDISSSRAALLDAIKSPNLQTIQIHEGKSQRTVMNDPKSLGHSFCNVARSTFVSCSTSTPINHIVFFLQNTSCIRKPQVISGRGAHPLHPPPRSAPETVLLSDVCIRLRAGGEKIPVVQQYVRVDHTVNMTVLVSV